MRRSKSSTNVGSDFSCWSYFYISSKRFRRCRILYPAIVFLAFLVCIYYIYFDHDVTFDQFSSLQYEAQRFDFRSPQQVTENEAIIPNYEADLKPDEETPVLFAPPPLSSVVRIEMEQMVVHKAQQDSHTQYLTKSGNTNTDEQSLDGPAISTAASEYVKPHQTQIADANTKTGSDIADSIEDKNKDEQQPAIQMKGGKNKRMKIISTMPSKRLMGPYKPKTFDVVNGNVTCSLPKLEPFDPSIKRLIKSPDPIYCENEIYPLLFELDDDGTLIQVGNYETYGYDSCCFSSFWRVKDDDNAVDYSKDCTNITKPQTKIPHSITDFIVSCRDNVTQELFHLDVFSIPRLNPIEVQRRSRKLLDHSQTKPEQRKLNVVILGLDAVSNMNFQRTMPRSRDYILNELSALTFDGYTKVGDNTLPNVMAFLTGQSLKEIKKTHWTSEDDFFDDCPFIWKNYSANGYYTSFAEDEPEISAFNYMKNGFRNPPADFYARPSLVAQDAVIGHEDMSSGNLCYGPRMSFEVLLKYMRNLAFSIKSNSNQEIAEEATNITLPLTTPYFNYFQFIWATALFHDFNEYPALGDAALLDTLQWFNNNNYLNDTIFILMSDHGIRWGAIRETFQGKIEERMPLLNIVMPEWFRQKYSQAYENMVGNKHRLTSHFDLYETLADILHHNSDLTDSTITKRAKILDSQFNQQSKSNRSLTKIPRGISLFLPIPTNRDCSDAGIDSHWCVCQTKKIIDSSLRQVQEAAREIVKHLNKMLAEFSSCAVLKLDKVLSAEFAVNFDGNDDDEQLNTVQQKEKQGFVSPGDLLGLSDKEIFYQRDKLGNIILSFDVTLRTTPGLGMFEASISKNISDLSWNVLGQVSRTNLYGSQSKCVKNSNIKLYCFCVD